jgi:hypothetical protein
MPDQDIFGTFNPAQAVKDVTALALKKYELDEAASRFNQEMGIKQKTLQMAAESHQLQVDALRKKNMIEQSVRDTIGAMTAPKTTTAPVKEDLATTAKINAMAPEGGSVVDPALIPRMTTTTMPKPTAEDLARAVVGVDPSAENLKSLVEAQRYSGENANAPYKVGHIQSFDLGEGRTEYREYTGNGQWKPRPDLGGKTDTAKGYETAEDAFKEAQRMLKLAGPDAGVVASVDVGPGNKYIPKLIPNISVRIPPFSPNANLPPDVMVNRKTGQLVQYDPETNAVKPYKPEGGVNQAAINWQALKKSAQTINGPVFKRLIDNAEILAVGVKDPKTGVMSKPELDQVADLRDEIPDRLFSKINSDFQAFNRWDQFLAYKVSDPKMARLVSKVMANVDTLANIYSGGGTVTSDFKMKFAKDLFETALSKESFRAKMDTHKQSVIERARKYGDPNPAGVVNSGSVPGVGKIETDGGSSWEELKKKKGW